MAPSPSPTSLFESGTSCGVCFDSDASVTNPLVYCDRCNLCVHVECYGAPLTISIPSSEWYCDRCKTETLYGFTEEYHIYCSLCPVLHGAMKMTTDHKMAHLSCAQWIPEVFFRLPDQRDLIDTLSIQTMKYHRKCLYCDSSYGVCTECTEKNCGIFFHVTCGMSNGVFLEYKQSSNGADVIVSYCHTHAKRWIGRKPGKGKSIIRATQ